MCCDRLFDFIKKSCCLSSHTQPPPPQQQEVDYMWLSESEEDYFKIGNEEDE